MELDREAGTVSETFDGVTLYPHGDMYPSKLVVSWSKGDPMVYRCTVMHPYVNGDGEAVLFQQHFQLDRLKVRGGIGESWPARPGPVKWEPDNPAANLEFRRTAQRAVSITLYRPNRLQVGVPVLSFRNMERALAAFKDDQPAQRYVTTGLEAVEHWANRPE